MAYKIFKLIIGAALLDQSVMNRSHAFAEETTVEKVEAAKDKAVDSVKKTYRKVDDKICEIVNGKMECVAKKLKHGLQNSSDKIETEINESINKVD